ncbi:Cht3p [Dermatophagoides pteronyssinus]|uniref:Cht3p n=1 Tax=Dermatophagoides pteronyssinus TaxID=6956 RepID=A0ABQ8JA56_DERPT|nr:Cht3p [Dermatophagoides pteronyssinus]
MKTTLALFCIWACVGLMNAATKRDHNNYSKNPMRIVCYVGTWSVYHKVDPYTIEDIDPFKCTHLMYGFAKIDEYKYTIQVFDPFQDDNHNSWEKHGYERFNNLRLKNPELTTMISLGGWYEGSEKYSDMAANPTYRQQFVQSVLDFLQEYKFDGLDLDWEYPGSRLGNPKIDKQNYLTLVRELKEAFEPFGYLLTAAVSPGKDKIDVAYELKELNQLFDWMNVMTYDYHGGWENVFGHNAPLYKRPDETDELHTYFNVNYTMHYYLNNGATRDKLVMGVPFYGRAWSIEDRSKVKLGDPAKGMSPPGFITGEEGVLSYIELCQLFQKEEWHIQYDEYYNAPYGYNGKIWVGYDDLASISCKLAFLKELGVSGVMIWSLENDDFKGHCGPKYPLLNKVHNMINGDEKNSYECLLGPSTTTPTPTTPSTPSTTTPTPTTPSTPSTTTPTPTTPSTPSTTTPTPTTPSTPSTTTPTPTTPSTPSTTTPTPTTTDSTSETPKYTTYIDGHLIKCYKQGYLPHPTDVHKYLVCEYIATPNGGWWVHIMDCPKGTRWHATLKNFKRDHNNYSKNPMRIVCYVGTWSVYHKVDPYTIEDIDPFKCTHLMYGFAKIDEYKYTIQVFDPYQDDNHNSWEKHGYERFNNLRSKNPELTTMISLGGWYEGSEKYSDMAANPTYRHQFVQSVLDFLQEYKFDGLDLDWEYPGSRLGNPKIDKQNYLTLVRELKEAFEPFGYLLTAAVSPGKDKIDVAYELKELNQLFDWMNVMTYDYHGGWENVFGHNAPLYKRPDETDELHTYFNVNYTMHYYLNNGATRDKLVMGVPFYGRAWSIEDRSKVKLGDPAKGMSPPGFITGEEGVLSYIELCQLFQKEEWHIQYDEYYNAPYGYNDKIWVGYDDLASISCKLAFLKELGVSGVMIWSLENDDFKGHCGPKYPLLNKVHNMINGDEKNSYECLLGPSTTTPTPTTPSTPSTTTPTPTTPSTPSTTTPTPTTPSTPSTTTPTPTTPSTTSTTTPTPTTTDSTSETPKYTTYVDGHLIKCYKEGDLPHPTNIHKYLVCEYVNGGWWVHIMPCPPGTIWCQEKLTCITE